MLIERGRIVAANRAAQRLLGAHIEGEDARIAIRHPAAAERLASQAPLAEPVTIELVGLGARDPPWQMRIAPVGDRKGGVEGNGVSVRVDLGGRRVIKKKKKNKNN